MNWAGFTMLSLFGASLIITALVLSVKLKREEEQERRERANRAKA